MLRTLLKLVFFALALACLLHALGWLAAPWHPYMPWAGMSVLLTLLFSGVEAPDLSPTAPAAPTPHRSPDADRT